MSASHTLKWKAVAWDPMKMFIRLGLCIFNSLCSSDLLPGTGTQLEGEEMAQAYKMPR